MTAAAAHIAPDRPTLDAFVGSLFRHADEGTTIALRAFADGKRGEPALFAHWATIGHPRTLDFVFNSARQAAEHESPGNFCPPVCTFNGQGKADRAAIANGIALTVECDARPKEARRALVLLLGEPTITSASGGDWTNPDTGEIEPKLHLHWRLTEPTRDAEGHAQLEEARRLACAYVGADASAVPINHPLRWPGSVHRKGEPRLARIVRQTETEIELVDALDKLRAVVPAERQREAPRGRAGAGLGLGPDLAGDVIDIAAALAVIPNDNLDWVHWNRIALATQAAGGTFAIFDAWSRKSAKYDADVTAERWEHVCRFPANNIGAGTLFFLAQEAAPGWRKPSDINRDQKRDARDRQDEAQQEQPQDDHAKAENPFALKWHGDVDDAPLKEWLVEKTLPKVGKALLSGQWGTYKTFVGFDLSAAIITKGRFAGRDVGRQGGVLWMAVEGQDEVRIRLAGLVEDKIRPAIAKADPDLVKIDPERLPFVWVEACPKLTAEDALPQLRHVVQAAQKGLADRHGLPLAMILIDTLSPAAEFKDANDTAENQRAMNVLTAVAREFQTLVVAVDHFGKDVTTGTRNSSVKEADVDAVLALLGEKDLSGNVNNPRMAIRKVRGAPTGTEIPFTKRVVQIKDGEGPFIAEESTLVIDWASNDADIGPKVKRWPKSLKIFKAALDNAMGAHGKKMRPFNDNLEVLAVDREQIRDEFLKAYPADDLKTKGQAFRRCEREAIQCAMMTSRDVGGQTFFWLR